MTRTAFADDPLWAALQEPIYADPDSGATALGGRRRSTSGTRSSRRTPGPLRFTGEMMYPWMFEEIRLLRPFGPAVDALAAAHGLGPLYDHERLAANEVPVAAAVYFDDLYVDAGLQLETAREVGEPARRG